MNKVLLTLSTMVLSSSLFAQESPITARAKRVQISEGPEIALAAPYLTVIRWTVNNPGGLPVHYAVVHYGTDRKDMSQTAKNSIRLNPYHPSTVFRVNLYDLPPKTTYYYKVESVDSTGRTDGVTSQIKKFTTPDRGE
ncbi:MAG TPA: fibronectin type III domain-containing protein [Nitrospiraceae bacterium]|nr:fibronectin type III domain-containing protein [Nitrospiraceae bacterium]